MQNKLHAFFLVAGASLGFSFTCLPGKANATPIQATLTITGAIFGSSDTLSGNFSYIYDLSDLSESATYTSVDLTVSGDTALPAYSFIWNVPGLADTTSSAEPPVRVGNEWGNGNAADPVNVIRIKSPPSGVPSNEENLTMYLVIEGLGTNAKLDGPEPGPTNGGTSFNGESLSEIGTSVGTIGGATVAAPEPASMTLVAVGLGGIFASRRRRRA